MSNASAFVTRAVAAFPSFNSIHQEAITNFINGLDQYGLFGKMDLFYMLKTQSSAVAVLNLVSSQFTLVDNGSPTFTADAGYTGVDASATVYLDTNYAPSGNAVQYGINSAHIMARSLSSAISGGSGGAVIGYAAGSRIFPYYNDGNYYSDAESASQSVGIANTDSRGVFLVTRGSSVSVTHYKSAVSQGVSTEPSAAFGAGDFLILAQGVVNIPQFGSACQIACASVGSNLTQSDATNLQALITNYDADLIAPPYYGYTTSLDPYRVRNEVIGY